MGTVHYLPVRDDNECEGCGEPIANCYCNDECEQCGYVYVDCICLDTP